MVRSKWFAPAMLATIALAAACSDDATAPSNVVPQVIEETEFDASLGIDLNQMTRSASGLYVLVTEEGEGEQVGPGNSVVISYVGRLSNAVVFDSGSFPLTIGSGGAIAGFDEGVRGMRLGEKRRIIMPPALGYGNRVQGPIPGGSILIFDLELTAITS